VRENDGQQTILAFAIADRRSAVMGVGVKHNGDAFLNTFRQTAQSYGQLFLIVGIAE
jgi:hypothetical protein